MKRLLTPFIILVCSWQLFAQKELSVSIGPAMPTGDFADKTNGGGARTGFMTNLIYQSKIQESKFWFASMLRYQSNGTEAPKINGLQNYTTATNWKAISALFGIVLKYDISKEFSIEPRLMIGVVAATSPKITMYDAVYAPLMTVGSVTAAAFTNMVGTNFRYQASDKMGIIIGVDYTIADPKFNLKADWGGGIVESSETNQRLDTFSAMIGISFKLN